MHDGKNPDVMWVCVFILHNKSLGSCFRTLLLWQRLHPELCIDTCCYTCTYTHTYTCTLPSLLEKLGLKLAGYYRFYLFTLGFCHFLVNHCYLFRAHGVYWGFTPAFSGFYSTLTQFLNWVFCCFLCIYVLNRTWTNVCPCRPTSGYPTVTWRNCNWAARPSTSLWADAPAEHHWWDALIVVQTQLWRKTWKHDCHEKL